jgi:hypothetical protein
MMEKLHSKGHLDSQYFDSVDWVAIGEAMEDFPMLFRVWASKHVCGFCGVARMMKICGFWPPERGCPCCGESNETTLHLLLCGSLGMEMTWSDSIDSLDSWLTDVDTFPDIQQCIISTLRTRDSTASFVARGTVSILSATVSQDCIGWQNFAEGKISKEWAELQGAYYLTQASERTVGSWSKGLVKRLLEMVHAQWKHRNSVLHERDFDGMKRLDGLALRRAIHEQFDLGLDGLDAPDRHFICRGIDSVFQLPVSERKAWLAGIKLARATYEEADTSGTSRSRTLMENWVIRR